MCVLKIALILGSTYSPREGRIPGPFLFDLKQKLLNQLCKINVPKVKKLPNVHVEQGCFA